MTDPTWPPPLVAWLRRVDARWMGNGVPTRDRETWLKELVVDLAAARSGGLDASELVTEDPEALADELAAAYVATNGVEPGMSHAADAVGSPGDPDRAAAAGTWRRPRLSDRLRFFVAAAVGAVGALGVIAWGESGTTWLGPPTTPIVLDVLPLAGAYAILLAYALMALLVAAGAGLAVRVCFHDSPLRTRLALAATAGLLVSGAAVTLPTVAAASLTGYSSAPNVVIGELAMVAFTLALGLAAAGEVVWRRGTQPAPARSGA